MIKDAVMENDFLKNLDASQVREIVDSMFPREFERGSFVIREGDAGTLAVNKSFLLTQKMSPNPPKVRKDWATGVMRVHLQQCSEKRRRKKTNESLVTSIGLDKIGSLTFIIA